MSFNIAIVGATGKVGQVMREILLERNFAVGNIRFMASARSAGKKLPWTSKSWVAEGKPQEIVVENVSEADFSDLDFAIFSAGATVSREFCPIAAGAGAKVIDNSSAWRMDPDVPLIVSEVNPHALSDAKKGIIANPNCTTMVGMVALKPLHDKAGLKKLVISTYQAVSGAGQAGVDELLNQTKAAIDGDSGLAPKIFDTHIAMNVIPKCGDFTNDYPDETVEERKLVEESRKILEISDLQVSATCVRVGVDTGHSLAINAEFEDPISPEDARQILESSPGVVLADLPNPIQSANQNAVSVGRIRKDPTTQNGISLFVVGDNLRKGAALNAIQIAETIIQL